MTILFASKQPEICHIMADHLPEHFCTVFSSLNYYTSTVRNLKTPPDLLVVDYMLMNHDLNNIKREYETEHIFIPIIFYNDPVIILGDRVEHWRLYNIYLSNGKFDNNWHDYDEVFKTINDIVESPEYKPYISLMQKPLPLPKAMAITRFYDPQLTGAHYSDLLAFKQISNMKKPLFDIVEILYENADSFISIEKLCEEYSKKIKPVSVATIKVRLSELHSLINSQTRCPFEVITRNNNLRLLFIE